MKIGTLTDTVQVLGETPPSRASSAPATSMRSARSPATTSSSSTLSTPRTRRPVHSART
jgi:hypothetical protein